MELLNEVFSWSSISELNAGRTSLYTLTRVSKTMAALSLPEYIKANKLSLPILTAYRTRLSGNSFGLFPAWARSTEFAPRDELICHFTTFNVKSNIGAVRVGLAYLRPEHRPKSLTFEGDLNLEQGLALLDIAGHARAQIIEIDVYHLDLRPPTIKKSDIMIRKLAQTVELKIDWPGLPSQHWCLLLHAISAPMLSSLALSGDVPWNALASFLSRHPTITELHLPVSHITKVSRKYCTLEMPSLLSVKGQLVKVVSFLKLLAQSTKPSSIEGELLASNKPLITMVHKVVDALAICTSDVSLIACLTSTKENGPLTKTRSFPAETLKKWRRYPSRLAHLTRLRLIVSGLADSVLLVSPILVTTYSFC